jgi:rubrerythrin
MDREKQIEEMAKILAFEIAWDEDEIPTVNCLETAKRLYNEGYRKQSEGEWVKDKESKFEHRYHCSVCGFYLIGMPTKHCEECGSKMKGGTE